MTFTFQSNIIIPDTLNISQMSKTSSSWNQGPFKAQGTGVKCVIPCHVSEQPHFLMWAVFDSSSG